MPLAGSGVVAGAFDPFDRDDPVNYGNYFHGQIFLQAPPPAGGSNVTYRCAVDVKMPDGIVAYAKLTIKAEDISPVLALGNGYHDLARNSTSGAVDYVRSPFIAGPLGCAAVFFAIFDWFTGSSHKVWRENVGGSVLTDLESILVNIRRIYVFGEHFYNQGDNEHGMHDVHMNQGDPMPASGDPNYAQKLGWYNNSGTWQDGAVFVEHNDDTIEAFLIKFLTQSLNTD